jgi:hypothetical protein
MHHTTRAYILPLVFGTLLSLAAFCSVLWFVDPFTSGVLAHIFFYLTLFLAAVGVFALIGIALRKKFVPGMLSDQFAVSMRQAVLLSALVSALLILQANNILFWWVGITLVLFIVTVEIFFNA